MSERYALAKARGRQTAPRVDVVRLAIASSCQERVLAGFESLRQRRRFAMLTERASVPVAELSLVRHAPLAVPRSAR
jgi:hypothetical protein